MHTISRFSNSTRVDITVYQHGKCFIFLKQRIGNSFELIEVSSSSEFSLEFKRLGLILMPAGMDLKNY